MFGVRKFFIKYVHLKIAGARKLTQRNFPIGNG